MSIDPHVLFFYLQVELGNRLLPCFKTKSKIPFSDVNLYNGHAHAPEWGPDSSVSEISTIQLEFRDLTMLTKRNIYKVRTVDIIYCCGNNTCCLEIVYR